MPSGKTHDGITWGAVIPLTAGLGMLGPGWLEALGFGAGFLFAGLMFGPDLDVPSVQVRRWGPLRGIWTPYQRMFRHRSRWTHGLFLGPAFRLLYLGAWLLLPLGGAWLLLQATGTDMEGMLARVTEVSAGLDLALLGFVLLGIWAGSASHTLADGAASGVKRLRRFRKRRR